MSAAVAGIVHGRTASGWRRGCRCQTCRRALRRAAKVWWATGVVRRGGDPATRVAVGPVRRRVADLEAAGWSRARIARTAGVSGATISRVADPSTRRVSRLVARAVAAVQVDP